MYPRLPRLHSTYSVWYLLGPGNFAARQFNSRNPSFYLCPRLLSQIWILPPLCRNRVINPYVTKVAGYVLLIFASVQRSCSFKFLISQVSLLAPRLFSTSLRILRESFTPQRSCLWPVRDWFLVADHFKFVIFLEFFGLLGSRQHGSVFWNQDSEGAGEVRF